jgi:hypothetical protein
MIPCYGIKEIVKNPSRDKSGASTVSVPPLPLAAVPVGSAGADGGTNCFLNGDDKNITHSTKNENHRSPDNFSQLKQKNPATGKRHRKRAICEVDCEKPCNMSEHSLQSPRLGFEPGTRGLFAVSSDEGLKMLIQISFFGIGLFRNFAAVD